MAGTDGISKLLAAFWECAEPGSQTERVEENVKYEREARQRRRVSNL